MGTIVFGWDAMDEVTHMLSLALDDEAHIGKLVYALSAADQ
jgi:hypothetical protein